jgi:hypothetical protein
MLSVLTGEGWRTVDPFDIVAVYRGDDEGQAKTVMEDG